MQHSGIKAMKEYINEIKGAASVAGLSSTVLLIALLLTGGFAEFYSCVIASLASVALIICVIRSHQLTLRVNPVSIAVLTIAGFYLLTALYGTDGGEALIGFFKYLPVVLFALLLMQNRRCAEALRTLLPCFAVLLGLLSLPLLLIPGLGFIVDGRLGGFFQYPNTFAMFLLIGELLLLSKPKKTAPDIIGTLVLFALIIFTGSRSVFVLTVVFSFLILLITSSKKGRIILAASAVVLIAAIALLYPLLNRVVFINHLLSISIFESTFAGRLLYWRDALPLVLKHPFGMGYLGYYFTEQSVQTGIYAVRYVHNDILQLLLDVGWIPALILLFAVCRRIFSKETAMAHRLVLIAYLMHICFDFDLEFTAMWFVLLILLDDQSGKEISVKKSAAAAGALFTACTALYFSVVLGSALFGAPEASLSLYPLNTEAQMQVLTQADTAEEMSQQADGILSRNQYVQIAYSAKARDALSRGDIKSMMKYKQKIFEIAPFDYSEYEEYAQVLIYCAETYRESGDTDSMTACQKELIATRKKLNELEERLSYFGRIIRDQPQTDFSDDINAYIDAIADTNP